MTETLTAASIHSAGSAPLLDIRGLTVEFPTDDGLVTAVDSADLRIMPNQVHCLVGESGSGKSQTARAVLGLLDPPGRVTAGEAFFQPADSQIADLLTLKPRGRQMRHIRGGEVGMIFQEPARSLSPMHTVGFQVAEAMRLHRGLDKKAAWAAAVEALEEVRIPRAGLRAKAYPFELSGGMRQRVMIAIALAGRPRLLVADEPTTALDVTTQAQILALIREIQATRDMAVLFITHDLGVVADIADDVSVMRRGRIVETKPVHRLFAEHEHEYTRMLLTATPALRAQPELDLQAASDPQPEPEPEFSEIFTWHQQNGRARAPLVSVRDLTRHFTLKSGAFGLKKKYLYAIDGVSLDIYPAETLGLVGESGCGKSTLAKCLLRVEQPSAGSITHRLTGQPMGDAGDSKKDVALAPEASLRTYRQQMRMVFQDPFASLNPRMTVQDILAEPLLRSGQPATREALAELLGLVGLEPTHLDRYPHAFSGGQRQRIGIARAIATNPQVLLADEAVSALDVSVRAQILDLLAELQRSRGLSYLFISHDMSTVEHLSDRVAVMYLGKLVETAPTPELFASPLHPYTETLLSAVPIPDPVRQRNRPRVDIAGELPDPTEKPSGCPFRNRCRFAQDICAERTPELQELPGGRQAACHFAGTLQLTGVQR